MKIKKIHIDNIYDFEELSYLFEIDVKKTKRGLEKEKKSDLCCIRFVRFNR